MGTTVFPAKLSFPYRERFRHDTSVAEMGGGRQVATALIASTGRLTVSGGLYLPQSSVTFDTIAAFVKAVRGRYDTFLYTPAHDYHGYSTAEAVATTTNGVTLYALDYAYPVAGTMSGLLDATPLAETTDFSLSDSAGTSWTAGEAPYVKLVANPGAGKALVITYQFRIPVRFLEDDPLGPMEARTHTGDSSADPFFLGLLDMEQDTPGSHLVTVPTP